MKYLRLKIIAKVIVIFSLGLAVGYFIIPKLLVYPPNVQKIDFQKSVEKYTQIEQYIIMGGTSIAFLIAILMYVLKDAFKINKPNLTAEEYKKIQSICYIPSTRIVFYVLSVYVGVMLISPVFIPGSFPIINVFFVFFATFSWVSVVAIVLSFSIKRDLIAVLNIVILKTGDYTLNQKKMKLSSNLIFTLLMTTIILFVFLFLFGYSTAAMRLGQLKYAYYNKNEISIKLNQLNSLESKLKSVPLLQKGDYYFIMYPNGKNITSIKTEIPHFMIEYTKKYGYKEKISYDSYVYTKQAYVQYTTNTKGEKIYYGHVYEVKDEDLLLTLMITLLAFIISYVLLLLYWAKNIVKPINEVAVSLSNVASGEDVDYDKKLPVTTNDEIGQIVDSYNKIQDLTKEYIDSINEKQDILVKQEQLVTLGELAGGMAHDINTPIAAINYGVDILSKQVTDEKQLEIVKTMKECTVKIISIVNDLRNQIRNLGTTDMKWFKLEQLVKESQVLVHNKLIQTACTLQLEVDPNIEVYGERNKLGQVITNMIVNAIQAYSKITATDKPVIVKVFQEADNAVIKIIDHAGGIPENMRETLFKAIMTTKGSEGTGIGMYLAYSVVRSVFKGNITFETATDQGTTFIITIPNNKAQIDAENQETSI